MKVLRIVLWVQVALFLAWGGYLLTAHRSAKGIWLETAPVDPRDFLSGNYVALRFQIGNISGTGCTADANGIGSEIFVRLEEGEKKVRTRESEVRISEAKECRMTPPADDSEGVWLRGTLGAPRSGDAARALYGIERFYVSERNPLRNARSGEVVAKVSVNRAHRARILDLTRIEK